MADSILIASGEIRLNNPNIRVTIHLHTDGVKVDKGNTNAPGDFFADITARPSNTVRIEGEGFLSFKNTSVIPNETLALPAKLVYGVNDLRITIQPIQIPMIRVGTSFDDGTSFEDIAIVFTQEKGDLLKMESGKVTMVVLGHGGRASTTDTHRNEVPLNLSLLDSGIVATLIENTKIRIPFIGKEQRVGDEFEGMSVLKEIIIPDTEDSVLVMKGTFRLDNAPKQLDRDIEATFDLVRENPTITIKEELGTDEGKIREELNIQALDLTWTLRDAPNETVSRKWEVAGNVTTSFWKNEVKMRPTMVDVGNPDNQRSTKKRVLSLTSTESPVTIGLDDWGNFDFTTINLKTVEEDAVITWALSSEAAEAFTILPKLRHRAFDLFSDFLLETYQLGITATDLVLQGRWLEEDLTFVGKRKDIKVLKKGEDNEGGIIEDISLLVMEANTKFMLPFDYEIPPLIDLKTGAEIFDGRKLIEQNLTINLDLDLSRNGLLTEVASDFLLDNTSLGNDPKIRIPAFTLFTPPPSKNSLLAHILTELTASSIELFANKVQNTADFSISGGAENQPLTISLSGGDDTQLALDRVSEDAPTPTKSLTYDEVLTHYYGWNREDNYIDLVPGMRLKVDFQNYQFVQASDQRARRGFTGSGSTYYYLNTYFKSANTEVEPSTESKRLLGFDAFLADTKFSNDADSMENGGGGIIDFLRNRDQEKYFRLIYPKKLGTGVGPERVVTIIGADNYADLEPGTTNIAKNGSVAGKAFTFYFRGQASITPEIPVFIGDQTVYVSVGTTWRQLLERYASIPPAKVGVDLKEYVGALRPQRLVNRGANSRPTYAFINPPTIYEISNDHQDFFDLPVVKGDRFFI